MAEHIPVLVAPVLDLLCAKPGARIVDATLGVGGHAEAILRRLGSEGRLVGLDRDADMLARARARLAPFGDAARLVHAPHSELGRVAREAGFEQVDGVLLDLGICSAQLDDPERGLSFQLASSAELDMRMDRSCGPTAAELLEELSEDALVDLLRAGDVPAPRRVARALVGASSGNPIHSSADLVRALEGVRLPRRRHNPATLVFQALRMAVNRESEELASALEAAVELLAPGGRLVVISYHSGDDRVVKRFLAREERGCICPPRLPRCACGRTPRLKILTRGVTPGDDELRANPRSRSARLRAGERW